MLFSYSDLVKNKVKKTNVDYDTLFNYGIETVRSKLKEFADTLNETFIDQLLLHDDIDFIFYTNDNKFSINKTIGIITYTKTNDKIYLLLICIDKKYRKFGYGKAFLEEFIQHVKNKHTKNKRLVLHSVDKAITFYETFGFVQVVDHPSKYRKLFKYEKYDKNANLMELEL